MNEIGVSRPKADQPLAENINMFPAGFLIRLLAFLTDSLIFCLISLLFLFLVNLGNKNLRELVIVLIWFILLFLLFGNIVRLLYFSYLTSRFGATLGKMLAAIYVVDENGNKLSFKRSFFRHLIGYMVSSLLFGAGFLWIIKDPNKQGWHDQLTGSLVLKKRGSGIIIVFLVFVFLLVINVMLVSSNLSRLINNTALKSDIEYLQNLTRDSFPESQTDEEINVEEQDYNSPDYNYPSL